MPIRPLYEWEQTVEDVLIKATLKGYRGKGKMVSIIIADFVVTVNATPYLLMLDTLHELDPEKSTYHFEDEDDAAVVHLKLRKKVVGETWDALCVSMSKAQLLERRGASLKREEERYNQKLDARAGQLKAESRRMTEEQWEVEKKQRQVIEGRVEMEKTEAEEDLYSWEEQQQQQQQKSKDLPATPADIARGAAAAAAAASQPAAETSGVVAAADPRIRHFETTNITIDFTPKSLTLPTRSRGDEEYYRQSRYKPVSIEDSPMFWKHRADSFYKEHSWKAAVEAYSESIKRDGVFLTCVMDRAACYLHLMEYRKCIDDCTLALTMLANTPASEITQDRYRGLMTKIHARRGAAYCWSEDLKSGVQDLRMAAAYRDPNEDHDVEQDLQLIEKLMEERGIVEDERDPQQTRMQEASAHYYHNKYEEAVEMYQAILEENPYHPHGRSNLIATFLHMGRFREALEECQKLIAFCGEVADALQQRAGGDLNQADRGDSDDEDEEMLEDERVAGEGDEDNRDDLVRKHRAASRKIAENSAHVYLLLKTYVRASSALCGMHRYQEAYPYLEKAVQIAPYDNDLREDANRLIEKIRMDTLVSASSMSAQKNATPAPATVAA